MAVGTVLAYGPPSHTFQTDTGWKSDNAILGGELLRSVNPLGLGFDDFKRGSRNPSVGKSWSNTGAWSSRKVGNGALERVLSSKFCSSSSNNISPTYSNAPQLRVRYQAEVGARNTLLFRQAEGFYQRRRAQIWCRGTSPRGENTSFDDKRDIKLGMKGSDGGSLGKQESSEMTPRLVGATNGATVHVETSDKEIDTTSTSLAWWNRIPRRYVIVGLCFIAFLLCNMDRFFPLHLNNMHGRVEKIWALQRHDAKRSLRIVYLHHLGKNYWKLSSYVPVKLQVNMSIAIMPMSEEFRWSPTTVGLVQSSFFWGYLLTQIAGGIWADSIGGKQVLGFGVIWWSLATIATPIAAKIGLPALLFVRACMGVGEGVAMPAMNNMLSRWVPVRERSRSLALVYSGMYLGSVTGLAFSPGLIHKFGWPSVFFSFGSLGALWFASWQQNAYSSPSEDPSITDDEKKLIMGESGPEAPVTNIPWRLLLSKGPVWALIICHFCHNWGTFILLTWMPTYYNQVLGFNLMESGLFSVLPWLTMALSANLGGWIADTLVSRGVSVTLVRKIMQSIGFLGPAFFLTQLSHITSPHMAVLCMMASQGSDAFSQSGLYSNHQDIGPRYSGVLLGMSNTAGVLAGVFGTAATGYILQHGSWDDVFKVAVGLYLFGTVVWNLFSSGEKIFD